MKTVQKLQLVQKVIAQLAMAVSQYENLIYLLYELHCLQLVSGCSSRCWVSSVNPFFVQDLIVSKPTVSNFSLYSIN